MNYKLHLTVFFGLLQVPYFFSAQELKDSIVVEESAEADTEWQRLIPLQLVPHPKNVELPTAIEMDYGMDNQQLLIEVRAAMAGYLLRRWNVDCTERGTLKGAEYQLWLQNRFTLNNVQNLAIAPGYKDVL